MTKELEALEIIAGYVPNKDTQLMENDTPFRMVELFPNEIDLIRKALTPPTADEVCKAIEEDTKLDVVYIPESPDSSELEFRLKSTFSLICKVFDKKICIYYMLAPRTLSLIGRFYESLEVEK